MNFDHTSSVKSFVKFLLSLLALVPLSCDRQARDISTPSVPTGHASFRPQGRPLTFTLSKWGEARVARTVGFTVRIKNVSDLEVDGVPSLDGSDVGMRFPLFTARFFGPDGEEIPTSGGGRCGNCNWLRKTELVCLKPGEEFDPFSGEGFLGHGIQRWTPRKEGKHRLILTVDYSAADPAEWNGPEERLAATPEKVRQLLARVPIQRMEESLVFEVVK